MSVSHLSASEIGRLSQNLGAIEDWLRDKCEARHADDMADVISKVVGVLEDLYDEASEREHLSDPMTKADVEAGIRAFEERQQLRGTDWR